MLATMKNHMKSVMNLTKTYCAILAVSPAAWRHPQMPACFRVCCSEPPPKDTPSHDSTVPELCKAQSTALLQCECAALEKKKHAGMKLLEYVQKTESSTCSMHKRTLSWQIFTVHFRCSTVGFPFHAEPELWGSHERWPGDTLKKGWKYMGRKSKTFMTLLLE